MKTKLVKLDKRHSGHTCFTHRVEFLYSVTRVEAFVKTRNTLWELFGPSAELSFLHTLNYEPTWCWSSKEADNDFYIYLRDEALTHYLLKATV